MKAKFWTPEKLALLTQHYPKTLSIDLVKIIGTTEKIINQKANNIGLRKDKAFRKTISSITRQKSYAAKKASMAPEIVKNIFSGKLIIKGNVTTHIGI